MRFTDEYRVTYGAEDDWYDPLLNIDTALGIDPFLVLKQRLAHFENSETRLTQFFQANFELIAAARGDVTDRSYLRAVRNLRLGEMEELCLGLSEATTAGSGAGHDLANSLARGMWRAINAGVADPRHFEATSIFSGGFGLDRISDIVGHIILPDLAQYTRAICERHGVPLTSFAFVLGEFNAEGWTPATYQLPKNPFNGKAVLLVPKRYLREFLTIDGAGFWNHVWVNDNEELRDIFGEEITRRVDLERIIDLANAKPGFVREYVDSVDQEDGEPYDVDDDPSLLIKWDYATRAYTEARALRFAVETEADFFDSVNEIINDFRHYLEQNGGWELLHNDDGSPRKERASQRLLLGQVSHGCEANDIDVTPEADIGRGPVDFKFSRGYQYRVHLEVKKTDNTRFWDGLTGQLPTYMRAEKVRCGIFLAVAYSAAEIEKARDYRDTLLTLANDHGLEVRVIVVDARQPPSGSRVQSI